MIEILLLRAFYRKLAAIAEEKNRVRTWAWLGVLFWFAGEVAGFLLAGIDGGGESYLAALACASIGALLAYLIVQRLPELPPPDFPTATVHRGG